MAAAEAAVAGSVGGLLPKWRKHVFLFHYLRLNRVCVCLLTERFGGADEMSFLRHFYFALPYVTCFCFAFALVCFVFVQLFGLE